MEATDHYEEMGTGWSQDEAPQLQQSEEQRRNESQYGVQKTTETKLGKTKSEAAEKAVDVKVSVNKGKAAGEVKLPHNCDAILGEADTPIDRSSLDKLYDQLCSGVFLKQKRKKYWFEKKSNVNCFMLFARDLSITWSQDNRFWQWAQLSEKSDVLVDVAELLLVCWLEVHVKFDTTKLSPGILYEVAFVIMIKDPAYGWEIPVNLRLILPNGSKQEHKENLMMKPRVQWIEIPVGEFKTSPENMGEMEISMYEYEGGIWKRGLVIKGVAIRPKNSV